MKRITIATLLVPRARQALPQPNGRARFNDGVPIEGEAGPLIVRPALRGFDGSQTNRKS